MAMLTSAFFFIERLTKLIDPTVDQISSTTMTLLWSIVGWYS